jgi:uncharacterized DUF497 family protein
MLRWDVEKNKKLQLERGISFEEIEYALAHEHLLDVLEHPKQDVYPGQLLLIVKVDNYAVVVPVIRDVDGFFLKTAFFSRKMTKKYLGR